MVELACLFKRELDHSLRPRGKHHLLLHGLSAPADDGFDLLTDLRKVDAKGLEDFGGQAFALGDNPKQNMLGSNVVVSEALRFFLSKHDAAPRSLGEGLPHRHRSGSSFPLSINTYNLLESFPFRSSCADFAAAAWLAPNQRFAPGRDKPLVPCQPSNKFAKRSSR